MRNRIVIIMLFTALATVWCIHPRVSLKAANQSSQQTQRKKQSKRTTGTSNSGNRARPSRDYSQFSHRSDKHKSLTCDACHKAPTYNWPAASGFPDVADYPEHDACARCHRTEFFRGALPVICSICHTKVSPRGKQRFAFGKPNQSSQFSTIFPHDLHQDVIALNNHKPGVEAAHAVRHTPFAKDEKKETYNNCTICHETQSGLLNPQGGFQDNFQPPAGTFKAAPVGHASCFDCHWKNQEPTHQACKGCHNLSPTDITALRVPQRKSLKFNHSREDHLRECTACHINITRETSLVGLKPDVPITSCSGASCHGASPKATKVTIETESDTRTRDPGFVCAKCHTSEKGKLAVPPSHRAALIE